MPSTSPLVTIVGSINMDLVIGCAKLPRPGETVLADSSAEVCGGKGANQAVAAARAGARAAMVGRIGDDAFAARLRENLVREGIDCTHVLTTPETASGLAVVAVEASGENSIVVVPGANGEVSVDDVRSARSLIEASDVVLVQLEIPQQAVLAAIAMARAAGVRVILDPAPVSQPWTSSMDVDLICPNESEAGSLLGRSVDSLGSAESAARELHQRGAEHVVVTRGQYGSLWFDGHTMTRIDPFPAEAVDTTASGDAFAGALAVRWAEQASLSEALRFANAAGSLAASAAGAQPSLPTREQIERRESA